MQGSLLQDSKRFNSFELAEQREAIQNLNAGLNTYRPLQLLFILDKISKIGK